MKNCSAAMVGAAIFAVSGPVPAEPMSRDQAEVIIQELREIKQILANQQQPAAPVARKPQNLTLTDVAIHPLGRSDAPLTLVAFTDYQCPFCERFETNTFPQIKKSYIDTGKVRFVLRDLPLDSHPLALKAAQSVRCAGDQGRYWEMKQLVFKNQKKIDADALARYAKALSLDTDSFRRCMADGRHLKEIRDEAKYAQSLGITGTPTFVLGKAAHGSVYGQVIVGAQPFAVFEASINAMLEKR